MRTSAGGIPSPTFDPPAHLLSPRSLEQDPETEVSCCHSSTRSCQAIATALEIPRICPLTEGLTTVSHPCDLPLWTGALKTDELDHSLLRLHDFSGAKKSVLAGQAVLFTQCWKT